jgi:hypothetical protein
MGVLYACKGSRQNEPRAEFSTLEVAACVPCTYCPVLHTTELRVENSAQTTFRFSPFSYRAPRLKPSSTSLLFLPYSSQLYIFNLSGLGCDLGIFLSFENSTAEPQSFTLSSTLFNSIVLEAQTLSITFGLISFSLISSSIIKMGHKTLILSVVLLSVAFFSVMLIVVE